MVASRVVVVGAGVAGLTAAIDLARAGVAVELVERAERPGGKLREIPIGSLVLDGGPTVLTMRWVFDELFADAERSFAAVVGLQRARTLARHAWSDRERLDLFEDVDRSADEIGRLVDAAEARRFRRFCADARRVWETVETGFIRAVRPTPLDLIRGAGLRGLPDLWRIRPFTSLWRALGDYFHDARTRQLFGRYATYVGSSPFDAPATLMSIAHVEREGVWLVEGGLYRVANALAELATALGVGIRYGADVGRVAFRGSSLRGVELVGGERIDADAVILAGDIAAVATGAFGGDAQRRARVRSGAARSLSAVTWTMIAPTGGFPLERHNVFFSRDYAAEFEALFRSGQVSEEPTVYVCAQDRGGPDRVGEGGPERLLCLVNAPADGDSRVWTGDEVERCTETMSRRLRACGLSIDPSRTQMRVTTPDEWNRLYPATGGALYGQNAHGWRASFSRPGPRTAVSGLYLAGGSTHPGPGVPMAALSGRHAAAVLLADRSSTSRSRSTATTGGTSTPSATADVMG